MRRYTRGRAVAVGGYLHVLCCYSAYFPDLHPNVICIIIILSQLQETNQLLTNKFNTIHTIIFPALSKSSYCPPGPSTIPGIELAGDCCPYDLLAVFERELLNCLLSTPPWHYSSRSSLAPQECDLLPLRAHSRRYSPRQRSWRRAPARQRLQSSLTGTHSKFDRGAGKTF